MLNNKSLKMMKNYSNRSGQKISQMRNKTFERSMRDNKISSLSSLILPTEHLQKLAKIERLQPANIFTLDKDIIVLEDSDSCDYNLGPTNVMHLKLVNSIQVLQEQVNMINNLETIYNSYCERIEYIELELSGTKLMLMVMK